MSKKMINLQNYAVKDLRMIVNHIFIYFSNKLFTKRQKTKEQINSTDSKVTTKQKTCFFFLCKQKKFRTEFKEVNVNKDIQSKKFSLGDDSFNVKRALKSLILKIK